MSPPGPAAPAPDAPPRSARSPGPSALGPGGRRTLAAFAEALIPAGGPLPGAEAGGVAVVDPVDRMLRRVPARTRLVVRAALRAFELTSFPRRFSRMALERRAAHIARLERGRIGPLRDLTLLLKGLTCFAYGRDEGVEAAIGAHPRCERAAGADDPAWEPLAPPLDPDALAAPPDVERCDVVVVGSGAGGATAARLLAELGADVIVVEAGDHHDASTFSPDPIDAISTLYRDGGLTFCEGRPGIPLPVGSCVGGTTVVNSGTCLRPPSDVLARWRDEHGIPWATELDEHVEAVERALHVAPVDPATAGRNAELCRLGAEALGASNGPIPRNAGRVSCCGACPMGCPIDGKLAMHVSELPRAVASGARVRARARVQEVLLEAGRAVGVAARTREGARYEVRSRAVLLAGGALGTPELLMRQGLAAGSGHLGRHLRIHPACWVGALYDEPVRGWEGVMQSWFVDEWRDRGVFLEATFTPLPFAAHWLRGAGDVFKARLERFDRLGMIGVHLSERSEGTLRLRGGRLRIRYRLRREDAAAIRYGIARAADVHFAAGAREVYPQVGRIEALAPGEQRARLEHGPHRSGELRLEGFHPMGTARMGRSPQESVVDLAGQVHGTPALYVADASVFPTAVKANPMVTIMACARRIAGGLADQLA
jgi:choline dehydrogenase-like flavoprotein